jgi:hypothetical protein
MTLFMLVLSVVASPRPLKQAKIRRGDLDGRDDGYDDGYGDDYKHKPSKIYYPPTYPTPPPPHYYP